jgi:protein-disulfide isomerase
MKRAYIYSGVVLVVVLAAAAYYFWAIPENPLALAAGTEAVQIKPTDEVKGSPSAPVVMVEYASMTCPHCAAFNKEVIPQLFKDYVNTGKVRYVFREYPLDGAARMASAVARCLSGDKFFSFIDLLFANQVNWIKPDASGQLTKESILAGLEMEGRIAGMSKEMVDSCASNKDNLALVDANWQEGMTKYGVDSTPTFIIAGVPHAGEIPYDQLKKILDPLVAKG